MFSYSSINIQSNSSLIPQLYTTEIKKQKNLNNFETNIKTDKKVRSCLNLKKLEMIVVIHYRVRHLPLIDSQSDIH